MIAKELLDILACPKCKGALQLLAGKGLACKQCMLLFEIQEGIPVMLIEEAKELEEADLTE